MQILASLLNLTGPDTLLILAVVLVLFGPKKLPELARGLRQAMNEFNKAKDDVERELTKANDVVVQPAPGQQPRQAAVLPPAAPPGAHETPPPAPPVALDPTAQAPQPVPQPAQPVEATHPAGQV